MKLSKEKVDHDLYSDEDADAAIKIIDGIEEFVKHGGYREGERNTIVVDLCCAMSVLGVHDDVEIKKVGEEMGIGGSLSEKYDFYERVERVVPYLEDWDGEKFGVFEKMINGLKVWSTWAVVSET